MCAGIWRCERKSLHWVFHTISAQLWRERPNSGMLCLNRFFPGFAEIAIQHIAKLLFAPPQPGGHSPQIVSLRRSEIRKELHQCRNRAVGPVPIIPKIVPTGLLLLDPEAEVLRFDCGVQAHFRRILSAKLWQLAELIRHIAWWQLVCNPEKFLALARPSIDIKIPFKLISLMKQKKRTPNLCLRSEQD